MEYEKELQIMPQSIRTNRVENLWLEFEQLLLESVKRRQYEHTETLLEHQRNVIEPITYNLKIQVTYFSNNRVLGYLHWTPILLKIEHIKHFPVVNKI